MGHWARADLRQAQRLAAELRELGEATDDVPMQVLGCDAGGQTCFNLGEFTAGRAYQEKALALYDPAHRHLYAELLPLDAQVWLRIHSSWMLTHLGHLDQALFESDAALDEARRLSHPPTLAIALTCAGFTRFLVRFPPRALLHYADELLALATEFGFKNFRAQALLLRGWSLAALGRADEGIPLLKAGLAGHEELGIRAWRPSHLTLLGDAYGLAGQAKAALQHLAEAQRLAEETNGRWCQAMTLQLRGDVLAATGDRTGAEAGYREAIAIAQQQSARLWELRAAISLARLCRGQRRPAEARVPLAAVYNWFTEGFGTPVLKEAKALLEAIAA
jgi:predicted ATPase